MGVFETFSGSAHEVSDLFCKIPYGGYVSYVRIDSAVFYFFVARTKAESATGRRLVGDWSATESPSDD